MVEWPLDRFLWHALAAGLGVALIAAPLGVFIVWRRMAYFGDTLAHSALLGIACGILLEIDRTLAVVLVAVTVAGLLLLLERRQQLATDTLLGILSHSTLAISLVVIALLDGIRMDLTSYLFGDILAVSLEDILWIWGGGGFAMGLLLLLWHQLLAVTVHAELARVEGVPVERVRIAFMLMIALVIAVGMKIVGVLLITSMMILPAATARRFSRTPEQMALVAAVAGASAVVAGLAASWQWDTPAGPSVVVAATLLFVVSQLGRST